MNLDLSIIIVNYDVYNDVINCIRAIYDTVHDLNYEIIVVDNNSPDRNIDNITKYFPEVKYFPLDHNYGFGHANNIAMKNARGDFFLLINPDILVVNDSINSLYKFLSEEKTVAVTGPVFKKPDGGYEYYYTFFPSMYSRIMQEFGLYFRTKKMKKRVFDFMNDNISKSIPFGVDWVLGACMMVKSEVYNLLGGLNEAFFLFEEETEWQFRMHKYGWFSKVVPQAVVIHNHHSSVSKFGSLFVNFHEFRSRIIFSVIQFKFPLIYLRKSLIVSAIAFHFMYFSLFDFKSFKISFNRAYLYFDLIKLVLMSKKKLLRKRFILEDYYNFFTIINNARF